MSYSLGFCHAVHKSFGSHQVLKGVDFEIPAGAVVGLIGTNGAGKSTLIHCLMGLLKADSGQVSLLGEDAWNLSIAAKSKLGFVPQTVQLYPWMTVQQIVQYTAAFYKTWDHAWVDQLLKSWSLPLDRKVGPLSQGQLQKLAIILAIGHRPQLLVLDEPVASLDPLARREFLRTLLQLVSDQEERTILFSTHITSDLERVASHLAILKDGNVVMFDELDRVKENVKRIRLVAESPWQNPVQEAGIIHGIYEDKIARLTVSNVSKLDLADWGNKYQAEVIVEDLSLEEIFLELHQA
jgi:ABC-2 type transport system ATP-binding protein